MRKYNLLILAFIIISCDQTLNIDVGNKEDDIVIKDLRDLQYISQKLDDNFDFKNILENEELFLLKNKIDNKQLASILKPLETVGEKYVNELLSDEDIPEDLRQELISLEGESLVMAGFIYLIEIELEKNGKLKVMDWDTSRVMSCLGTATGYSSIKAAIDVSGLMSANTLTSVLKAMGKRYLGYLGTAVMVYSFSSCMGLI